MDRYSFDELLSVVEQRYRPDNLPANVGDIGKVASVLNMEPSNIYRWRQYGLTWFTADRIAVKMGLHPAEIWPQWFDDGDRRREASEEKARVKKQGQRRARQASRRSHASSPTASTG